MLKWGPPLIGEQGPPDGYSGSEWHDCTVLSTCALAYVILSSSKIQNGVMHSAARLARLSWKMTIK